MQFKPLILWSAALAAAAFFAVTPQIARAKASCDCVPTAFNSAFTAPYGSVGPTNLELTILNSIIIPNQTVVSGIDPFCPPSCTLTVKQGSGVETLKYSGTALYPGASYHFGVLALPGASSEEAFPTVSVDWSYASTTFTAAPMPGIAYPGALSLKVAKYAVVYFETSFYASGELASQNWFLMPYNKKGNVQPKFSFTNFGSQTLYTGNAGIVADIKIPQSKTCQHNPACKAVENLLYRMNVTDMPPPGMSGSPFKKMEFPPPSVLYPGSH